MIHSAWSKFSEVLLVWTCLLDFMLSFLSYRVLQSRRQIFFHMYGQLCGLQPLAHRLSHVWWNVD